MGTDAPELLNRTQETAEDWWQKLDKLIALYEQCPYTAVSVKEEGHIDGFEMKFKSKRKKLLAFSTAGLFNMNVKALVEVRASDEASRTAWDTFVLNDRISPYNSMGMRAFKDILRLNCMAVLVYRETFTYIGTKWFARYIVEIRKHEGPSDVACKSCIEAGKTSEGLTAGTEDDDNELRDVCIRHSDTSERTGLYGTAASSDVIFYYKELDEA